MVLMVDYCPCSPWKPQSECLGLFGSVSAVITACSEEANADGILVGVMELHSKLPLLCDLRDPRLVPASSPVRLKVRPLVRTNGDNHRIKQNSAKMVRSGSKLGFTKNKQYKPAYYLGVSWSHHMWVQRRNTQPIPGSQAVS